MSLMNSSRKICHISVLNMIGGGNRNVIVKHSIYRRASRNNELQCPPSGYDQIQGSSISKCDNAVHLPKAHQQLSTDNQPRQKHRAVENVIESIVVKTLNKIHTASEQKTLGPCSLFHFLLSKTEDFITTGPGFSRLTSTNRRSLDKPGRLQIRMHLATKDHVSIFHILGDTFPPR
jgi:hypothetical protein